MQGLWKESGTEGFPARFAALFVRAEQIILATVTFITVALLASEIALLSAAVVFRYLLHEPLAWADEVNSLTFLWLSMLGAVIAAHRGQHLRLTSLLRILPARIARFLELAALTLEIGFLAGMLNPAVEHWADQGDVATPILAMPVAWAAAGIIVAFGLIIVVDIARLLTKAPDLMTLAGAVIGVVAVVGCMWLLGPVFERIGNYNLVVFFAGLLTVLMLAGVPIVFAFGIATGAYVAFATDAPLSVVVDRMDGAISNPLLLSIPLFVFLGLVIESAGLARAMINFLISLLGGVRGGLSYVLLGAMYLISGISGAKTADMAAVAPALFPEMKKRGADPRRLVSLLGASAVMAETVPPSLVLITVGTVTTVSISALFAGGLLPALFAALALAIMVRFQSRREQVMQVRPHGSRLRSFAYALPALALPFVIRTAVVEGVATATEVSTIGILYSVVTGALIYRTFDWRRVYPMLAETVALSGVIVIVIGTASGMSWALAQSGFSRDLIAFMSALPGGAATFMAVSILIFVVFGSILEGIPAVVLFAPLLFPITRILGINEVHYAMVAIMSMGLGLYSPPFGVGYYVACAIGKVDPDEAMSKVWPYLGMLLLAIVVVACVPWLSTAMIPN